MNLKGIHFALFYFILFLLLLKHSPFIIVALFLGLFFATIVDVPHKFLRKKIPERFSRLLSNFLILGIIGFAFANFFPTVINEGKKIFTSLNALEIANISDLEIPVWVINMINELNSYISNAALGLINTVLAYGPSTIIALIIVIITTFSITKMKMEISKKLNLFFPVDTEKGIYFIRKTYNDFEKFVKGQVLVAFFEGVFIAVSCFVFSIPGALFLGVLTGVGNFIPFLGVLVAAIPLAMLAYSANGFAGLIIALIILVIANQLETWVLSPKIHSDSLKIHWFVILISIMIAGDLFGVGGVLVALPVVMYFKNFWDIFILNKEVNDIEPKINSVEKQELNENNILEEVNE
jgi:predicted PurR-regulated permease PerM